jgi:hypothetical protein
MKKFWSVLGNVARVVAVYSIGHANVIASTVVDAKSKNIPGLAEDAAAIVASLQSAKQ